MEGVIIAMLDLELDIFQSFGHFSHKSHFFVGPLLDHFLIQFTTLGIEICNTNIQIVNKQC